MAKKARRSVDIHRFETNEPNKFIEISVSYSEGGSMWGVQNARAYYMHCTPIKIEQHDGYSTRSLMLFHGRKAKLEDASRFSQKKLDALAETARRAVAARDEEIMRLVNVVLAEENLSLAVPVEAA